MHGHAAHLSPKVVAVAILALALLTVSAVAATRLLARDPGDPRATLPTRAASPVPTRSLGATAPQPGGIPAPDLDAEVARLRAAPEARAKEAVTEPIDAESRSHPDLYAAEFARRLLTQDYRASREDLLAWVQAESALTSDPLVVGLVPKELRDKLAVFTVSDSADGPAPVPPAAEWDRLAASGAFATARVQRVTEPLAWTNAVEAGRITDPGLTARVVSAEVSLHVPGRVEVFSVELSLEFAGPPVRDHWGFVGAVSYTSMLVGAR